MELDAAFVATLPDVVRLEARSENRSDDVLNPVSGEHLSDRSQVVVKELKRDARDQFNTQIVISDGRNALAVMDHGQLAELLVSLRRELSKAGYRVSSTNFLVNSGRVRAMVLVRHFSAAATTEQRFFTSSANVPAAAITRSRST